MAREMGSPQLGGTIPASNSRLLQQPGPRQKPKAKAKATTKAKALPRLPWLWTLQAMAKAKARRARAREREKENPSLQTVVEGAKEKAKGNDAQTSLAHALLNGVSTTSCV